MREPVVYFKNDIAGAVVYGHRVALPTCDLAILPDKAHGEEVVKFYSQRVLKTPH